MHRIHRLPRSVLGILVGTTLVFAGCGGGKTEEKKPAETPPAASAPAEDSTGAAPPDRPPAGQPEAVAMGGRRKAGQKRSAPGALGAAGSSPTGTSATGGGPRTARIDGAQIEFDSRTVDLGTIWDVGTQSFTFPFRNVGRERLIIRELKASCGCTATTLAKREFDSGEGAEIEVTFSPSGSGQQSKTIDIVSNSVQGAVTRLVVDADIRNFVSLTPHVVKFDEVQLGETHSAIITLTSADPNLVVNDVEATVTAGGPKGSGRMGNYLTARILGDDPATTSPGSAEPRRHQIEVTLGKDAPWGVSYGHLEIASNGTLPDGEEVEHLASIHVVATVFNELHADDTMFRLAMMPPGTSFQRKIRLTRASGAPFAVSSVRIAQSTMSGMSVRATPIRETGTVGYEIVLSGNTGAFKGHVSGAVAIATDVEGEDELEIRFSGLVREINK